MFLHEDNIRGSGLYENSVPQNIKNFPHNLAGGELAGYETLGVR